MKQPGFAVRALLILLGLLMLAASCPPRKARPEVTWIGVEQLDLFTLEDAAAFSVKGRGERGRARIPLSEIPLQFDSADQLRLFRIAGDRLESVAFEAGADAVTAELTFDRNYAFFLRPTGLVLNNYDLLCRLRRVRTPLVRIRPRIIDRICLVILCPAEPIFVTELFEQFPDLGQFPREFPPEEIGGLRVGGFGGNVCDRCTGFGDFEDPGLPLIVDCTGPPAPRGAYRVVNIVPRGNSPETYQDSEPNVAVNPADPDQIVASAFTPNPAGVGNAPIYYSLDGGLTWQLNAIVQSQRSPNPLNLPPHGDITVRFTRTTGNLYAGILRIPGNLRLSIQSTADFTSPAAMTIQVDRTGAGTGPDQPYVQATDVEGEDRVYVGNNDLGVATGRTATVDQTVDGTSTWTIQRLETRATSGQDLPPVRPAIGSDNVIYVAYFGWRPGGLTDVVVVRDDNGATGANPYRSLSGSDGQPGVRVVTGRNVPFENFSHANFGQERLVASNLSIAVDPGDSARVCVAWGDRVGGGDVLTLHLRCSTNSGANWSRSDVRTVTNATNPALAFNSRGLLGFLYQAVEAQPGGGTRWVTHFERWSPALTMLDNDVLATVPSNQPPVANWIPYIGDYVHLMTVGATFYGIFSANNTPDMRNFPQGVRYQREANFGTRQLLDLDGNVVPISIDPFFFRYEP